MSALSKGTRVRFTASSLGCVAHLDSTRFEPETVHAGDEGEYLFPHPMPNMASWHVVEVDVDGRRLLVPLHEDQFEVVDG